MNISPSPQNNSSALSDSDSVELFEHCWRRNSCGSCLETHLPCGWCPFSQACVPATLGILSPISDPMVCPIATERFELRTRPLSCNVSTLTALTALTSILGTLLVVGTIYAIIKWRAQLRALLGRVRESWYEGSGEGLNGMDVVNENSSLLHHPRTTAAGLARRLSYWAYNTIPGDGDGGESRPRAERSDTSGEESEVIGGREFEERRRRMLQRSSGEA